MKIGNFELGKTIGSGGFAKVKIGRHVKTGEEFAVKIISKDRISKWAMKEQTLMEISITRLLQHDNVIRVSDVFQTDQSIFLVMELVRGCELLDQLAEVQGTGFPEWQSRSYFQQLIMGVHYCHEQGVIHRDLKPENILIDNNGKLKITDFGMASVQTRENAMCGSPNYVAPEVLKRNEASYEGTSADIWSCGVILYAMSAGVLPFDDPDDAKLFELIVGGTYEVPEHFCSDLTSLVAAMLVKHPSQRATIKDIVSNAWFIEDFEPDLIREAEKHAVVSPQAYTWLVSEHPSEGGVRYLVDAEALVSPPAKGEARSKLKCLARGASCPVVENAVISAGGGSKDDSLQNGTLNVHITGESPKGELTLAPPATLYNEAASLGDDFIGKAEVTSTQVRVEFGWASKTTAKNLAALVSSIHYKAPDEACLSVVHFQCSDQNSGCCFQVAINTD